MFQRVVVIIITICYIIIKTIILHTYNIYIIILIKIAKISRRRFFWVEKRKLDQNTERGHFRRHRVVQVSEHSRRS